MSKIVRKISDYKLSKFLIQSACEGAGCPFVDLNIRFNEDGLMGDILSNGSICISNAKSWFDINSKIVLVYFTHFEQICGSSLMMDCIELERVLDLWRSFLLFICSDGDTASLKNDEEFVLRLYQFPAVWLLMKDIICPAYEVQIENIAIAVVEDQTACDISEYLDKKVLDIETSFIGLNNCIEYKPVKDAFLFISVLEAHDLNAYKIIKEIMSSELQSKICGAMKLVYGNDKEVNDFLMILLTYVGIENKIEYLVVDSIKKASKSEMIKEAQFMNNLSNSFWFFGLIEKMLEPSRGSDWSVYKGLQPWFQEIQDRIEVEQKKAGRDGITYESLLRIHSGENTKEDNNTILEKNLGSDRVW